MTQEILNVLILCTGNSARSIMTASILNSLGKPRFKALSAGSRPAGSVNPLALEMMEKNRLPTEGLRSKDWSEFSQPGRRSWISCSRCAIGPRRNLARFGPDNR